MNEYLESQCKRMRVFSPLQSVRNPKIRAALFRLGLDNFFFRDETLRSLLNNIRCEAHRDVLIELLTRKLTK